MSQSKIITDDKTTRKDFKVRLANKVQDALVPKEFEQKNTLILCLPSNFESLSEAELLFTLTNNIELQHSQESAVLTVSLLYGRAARPENIDFQLVDLENPTEIPKFIVEIPIQRQPMKTAPGFNKTKDSTAAHEAKDAYKRGQFKESLADRLQQTLENPPALVKDDIRVLLIPSNYKELNEADLHFALVNNLELKHSHDSALLAIDILNKRVLSKNVELQEVELSSPIEPSIPRFKTEPRQSLKVKAKDVTTASLDCEQILFLPDNYQDLSEGELGFVLSRNPQFRLTPEMSRYVLDVLFDRVEQPTNIKFETIEFRQ